MALEKRSYRRISGIGDGNGGEHREPKTRTDAEVSEELEYGCESEETASVPEKRRRSAATVAGPVSSRNHLKEIERDPCEKVEIGAP
jgi:hypothetical protein